jgi:DNA-binding NarL/FixJ family response regulator
MEKHPERALRVLIVDDCIDVRRDLRTILTLDGNIEIAGEAANGVEAIDLAESLKPDVVLMDLEMPTLDGYEATRQIKVGNHSCRVIALTVHSYEEARQEASRAGVDDFIVKGASVENILRTISK